MFHRKTSESGFTLPELLVVMLLLGATLTVMYRGLASMTRAAIGTQGRLVNLDEARVVIGTVTKDLRTAARLTPDTSPFDYANEQEVIFYGNIESLAAPKKIHIYVDDDRRLVEKIVDAAGTSPNYTYDTTPRVRVVGRFLANDGPVFSYLDAEGNCLGGSGSTTPCSMGAPLTAEELLLVSAVEVVVSIREHGGPQPATLINRVRLPNVDYNPLIQTGG